MPANGSLMGVYPVSGGKAPFQPQYKVQGYHCRCGTYTGVKVGMRFKCRGCDREYELRVMDDATPEDRAKAALAELDGWIRMLHTAPRIGAEIDEPEGSRTIAISDTLATNLADCLRELRDTALKGLKYGT